MTRLLRLSCCVLGCVTLVGCAERSADSPTDPIEHDAPPEHPENRTAHAQSEDSNDDPATPTAVADDGFPECNDSPEGVACDLARAFMRADAELLRSTCLPLSRGADSRDAYNDFLEQVLTFFMESAQERPLNELDGPKEIEQVYMAQALSQSGSASYGYATMQLDDVKFVDVVTTMWDGARFTNRTLVVRRASDARWFAMPRPDLFPLLSAGLNEEPDPGVLWKP